MGIRKGTMGEMGNYVFGGEAGIMSESLSFWKHYVILEEIICFWRAGIMFSGEMGIRKGTTSGNYVFGRDGNP